MKLVNRSGALFCCLFLLILAGATMPGLAMSNQFPLPPEGKNVTISNGGLSITFNIGWGAVVVAVFNSRVAHGLNIVDIHDTGREFQVDQFLKLKKHGHMSLMINPTQAGAEGHQAYYLHPRGIAFPEVGSRVVSYKARGSHFHAVIDPLDYDTGQATNWQYVEDVQITQDGVARFHFTFYNHESQTYIMNSELPTLYSDRTDAFMYPLLSPYGPEAESLRREKHPKWPVKLVSGGDHWPENGIKSMGWIANIDTADNIGIFYTTPVGLREAFGTFPTALVSDRHPLGKSNVAIGNVISYPGEIYSIDFSALISTPRDGPAFISKQPPAVLMTEHNSPPAASKMH